MNMKKLHKDQTGFSLIELLIVIALTGIVTAAITMTVFQVFNMNTRTSNRMAAVSQVQQAGKLVSEDILEAQPASINVTRSGVKFLVLGWTAQNGTAYVVNYTLESMPSGIFNILWRKHYTNSVLDSTTKVAEYIDPDQTKTSCVWDGKVLTFKVTATVGKESETRVYEVKPRPGS
jgi:prepilin-type N-terminal cleavage/methylation domain-containing protein